MIRRPKWNSPGGVTATPQCPLSQYRRPVPVDVAEEATRVRIDDDRITAIGKDVDPYDALDTGLFVCDPSLFTALDSAVGAVDTTLVDVDEELDSITEALTAA